MDAKGEICLAPGARAIVRPLEFFRRLRDPAPPVAGLILDLCGVLYDDTAWQRWLLRLVGRMGLHTHYTAFFRLWRREYLDRVKWGELEFWSALRLFLRSSGLTHGQIDQVEAAGHAQLRLLEEDIHPLPGVLPTLGHLSGCGVRLALLCNDCLDMAAIEHRLIRLHLDHRFLLVISSHDLARQNAEQDPFRVAIDCLEISPDQLAYVGCDTAALQAAARRELRTVALNNDEDAAANIYLDCFDQLLNALPWESIHVMAG